MCSFGTILIIYGGYDPPGRAIMEGKMKKKVFQLLVENTSGVLSRISGLFARRGYNIESITAGVTADPRVTRITVVATGDDEILDQIEKQLGQLVDVCDIRELKPENSVYRELALIKIKVLPKDRADISSLADVFGADIIDVSKEGMIVEMTGKQSKIDAFLELLDGYEILELARTGIAGLRRGTDDIVTPKFNY